MAVFLDDTILVIENRRQLLDIVIAEEAFTACTFAPRRRTARCQFLVRLFYKRKRQGMFSSDSDGGGWVEGGGADKKKLGQRSWEKQNVRNWLMVSSSTITIGTSGTSSTSGTRSGALSSGTMALLLEQTCRVHTPYQRTCEKHIKTDTDIDESLSTIPWY